ncbi:MAG: hypothetical protein Q8891_16630 [Bacteroidota bacterium]|nr:hypothetical protein [Bacteroidota bacterium]
MSLFLLKEKVTKKFKDNPISYSRNIYFFIGVHDCFAIRVFVRPAPPKASMNSKPIIHEGTKGDIKSKVGGMKRCYEKDREMVSSGTINASANIVLI